MHVGRGTDSPHQSSRLCWTRAYSAAAPGVSAIRGGIEASASGCWSSHNQTTLTHVARMVTIYRCCHCLNRRFRACPGRYHALEPQAFSVDDASHETLKELRQNDRFSAELQMWHGERFGHRLRQSPSNELGQAASSLSSVSFDINNLSTSLPRLSLSVEAMGRSIRPLGRISAELYEECM